MKTADTGLRRGELLGLAWENIELPATSRTAQITDSTDGRFAPASVSVPSGASPGADHGAPLVGSVSSRSVKWPQKSLSSASRSVGTTEGAETAGDAPLAWLRVEKELTAAPPYHRVDPKTRLSKRSVPLTERAVEALTAHIGAGSPRPSPTPIVRSGSHYVLPLDQCGAREADISDAISILTDLRKAGWRLERDPGETGELPW